MVMASMNIKSLEKKHEKRLYDKWVVNIIYIVHCWYADIVLVYAMSWLLHNMRVYWTFHYFLIETLSLLPVVGFFVWTMS
jgi:hypothetical protein